MKKTSVAINYIYNTFFSVASLIVPLVTTPYISRVLGADNIGKYSYETSIVTYFTVLAAFGSSLYGQRAIACVQNDNKKLSETFWNVFTFRIILSLSMTAFYLIYVFYLSKNFAIALILTLNILYITFDFSWFFQGIENFKLIAIRNFAIKVLNLLAIFIFVKTKNDTWKYTLIISGFSILGATSLINPLRKLIQKPANIHPFRDIKELSLVFLPTIATQVYTVLDKSMIGWITSSDYANGCYEQSERIARFCLIFVTSLGNVMLPRVANLYNSGNKQEAKNYIYLSYRMVWLIGIPIVFGLIAIAQIFIPIFLGEGFDDSVLLLQIFSLIVVIVGGANTIGVGYLISTKQQNVYTISVTISAIFNICMNFILIPKAGATGAAIASVAAEAIGLTVQLGYCFITKQLSYKSVFNSIWKYFISGTVMFVLISQLSHVVEHNTVGLSIMILAGCLLYFVMLLILRDDFVINNAKMLLSRINKKLHLSNSTPEL